jgi:hypothetical protein
VSKYHSYIREFLIRNKTISLEKIGTFNLEGVIDEHNLQPRNIIFEFDKKALTTPELVTFVAEKTGKSKMITEADLSDEFEQARQFINIGKSYEFSGIGAIRSNNERVYQFTAADPSSYQNTVAEKKKKRIDEHSEIRKSNSKGAVMFVAVLIIVLILGVIGWGGYHLLVKNKNTAATETQPAPAADTAKATDSASIKDTANKTAAIPKDSVVASAIAAADSAVYRFVFERTNNTERAYTRFNQLKEYGDHVLMDSTKTDSSTAYRLYLKIKLPSTDTARVRDSLELYFNHSVRIVQQR